MTQKTMQLCVFNKKTKIFLGELLEEKFTHYMVDRSWLMSEKKAQHNHIKKEEARLRYLSKEEIIGEKNEVYKMWERRWPGGVPTKELMK